MGQLAEKVPSRDPCATDSVYFAFGHSLSGPYILDSGNEQRHCARGINHRGRGGNLHSRREDWH